MIDFFEGLSRGSFVRYTSKKDYEDGAQFGSHSYVFDGIDADGLGTWHYECNQDYDNGIGYQYYTFDLYYCKNKFVYEYVEHTLTAPVYSSTTKHKTPCGNCNGYLMRPHTKVAVNRAASMTNHTVGYQCCSGGVSQQHTGSATYQQYNDAKHKVSFSCCTGTVVQNHTYVNSRCTGCGKNKGVSGGIVASIPGIEETMNG